MDECENGLTRTVEDAAKIKNVDISSELCLPPVKCECRICAVCGWLMSLVHCSLLAEDAIKAAIKNYQTKRATILPTSLSGTSKELPKEA
jgi:NifU-like protein involved in Fe-S cluster formation